MFMTQHGIWHLIRYLISVCSLLFSCVPIYYVEPLEIDSFYVSEMIEYGQFHEFHAVTLWM